MREDLKDHQEADKRFQDESQGRDIEMDKKLDSIDKKLDPVLQVYQAVLLSKGFVSGLAGLIVGITVIGTAIMWVINQAVHK